VNESEEILSEPPDDLREKRKYYMEHAKYALAVEARPVQEDKVCGMSGSLRAPQRSPGRVVRTGSSEPVRSDLSNLSIMTLSSSIAFPVKGKKGRLPMWIDRSTIGYSRSASSQCEDIDNWIVCEFYSVYHPESRRVNCSGALGCSPERMVYVDFADSLSLPHVGRFEGVEVEDFRAISQKMDLPAKIEAESVSRMFSGKKSRSEEKGPSFVSGKPWVKGDFPSMVRGLGNWQTSLREEDSDASEEGEHYRKNDPGGSLGEG